MNKLTPQIARHRARKRAVQALYQWQVTEQDAAAILAQFAEHASKAGANTAYFEQLVRGVIKTADEVDRALGEFVDRPLHQVDPIERAILRLAAYELRSVPDVPYRVIIDEAVELTHLFGAAQGHAYVNGVLDRAARAWRTSEAGARD